MTRVGTLYLTFTISLVFSVLFAALEPSPLQAACSRWDVSGDWQFFQTNGFSPRFTLQLTETGIQGDAISTTVEETSGFIIQHGHDPVTVRGSVDGALDGNSFKITAYWDTGSTGVYTGIIGPQGRIEGSTYDAQHPESMARWHSDRTAKCLTSAGGTSAGGVSFESVNFPGQFLRHKNFLGELTPLNSELDQKDATFVIRPSLSGAPGAVSFESVNYPGQFLRHQNFRLKLSANDGTPQFSQDASFLPRSPLAGQGTVSYESVNFPGFFIRHRDFHLWVEQNDGSALFSLDATFRQRP